MPFTCCPVCCSHNHLLCEAGFSVKFLVSISKALIEPEQLKRADLLVITKFNNDSPDAIVTTGDTTVDALIAAGEKENHFIAGPAQSFRFNLKERGYKTDGLGHVLVIGLGPREIFEQHTACQVFTDVLKTAEELKVNRLTVPLESLAGGGFNQTLSAAILRCGVAVLIVGNRTGALKEVELICHPEAKYLLDDGVHVPGPLCHFCPLLS